MSDKRNVPIGYCALEYVARGNDSSTTNIKKVVLIVVGSSSGELSTRVHPDWHNIAGTEEREIFQALFDDVKERASLDPESLLEQLSSLSVGPLQTYDTGQTIADRPDLLELFMAFREI
jgi:hypothetical protein